MGMWKDKNKMFCNAFFIGFIKFFGLKIILGALIDSMCSYCSSGFAKKNLSVFDHHNSNCNSFWGWGSMILKCFIRSEIVRTMRKNWNVVKMFFRNGLGHSHLQ